MTITCLSACAAIVTLVAASCPAWARQADAGRTADASGQTPTCSRETAWGNRTFQGADWRATIILDPCVPESHATNILRAIQQGALVNAQPAAVAGPSRGVVPAVPAVQLSQVEWIAARFASGDRVDGLATGPFELYEVRTRSGDSPLRGLSLRVSIRGDGVEVRSVGGWLE
jgi:hypothetical protein